MQTEQLTECFEKEKRYDLIDAFNSTSRYLDDLLNIHLTKFLIGHLTFLR